MKKITLIKQILTISIFTLFLHSCGDDSEDMKDDIVESTLEVSSFSAFIDRGTSAGEVIGTLTATTQAGAISYKIVSQTNENALQIDEQTGMISIDDASFFVERSSNPIDAVVQVSDDLDSLEATVSVTVVEIWDGASINFEKPDNGDPNLAENQDRITDNVWITRDNDGGRIYNALIDDGGNADNKDVIPSDTEWARGDTRMLKDLSFSTFDNIVAPSNDVNVNFVVHLITDDIYIDLRFTSWSKGSDSGGGFAYTRSSQD